MAKTPVKSKKTATSSKAPAQSKQPVQKTPSGQLKAKTMPSALRLAVDSLSILRNNWKVFLGIALIYGALNVLLVQGFSAASSLSQTKETLDQVLGSGGGLSSSLAVFLYLVGSSGDSNDPTAGLYKAIFLLIASLAIIWALRQVYAGHAVRVRDTFYKGMAPLVQFLLVCLVVIAQLVPMAIGLAVYTSVTANKIAATPIEQLLWGGLALLPSLLTVYFLSSSLFALYIVTLPNMTPLNALRSAKKLVAKRRWLVIRKILFLPLALLIVFAVLVLPVIFLAAPVAGWIFFALTLLLLPVAHGYMYNLYRSML